MNKIIIKSTRETWKLSKWATTLDKFLTFE